ncbi:MAG TPA: aldo/keto reductase [Labilithrix sp.]|nr:aldo/keto reductase [Labilithrix sp.]
MAKRTVSGRSVGAVGLGCMGMTWAYGKGETERADHIRVIRRALEIGANLIDTADVYGPVTNEELVGEALVGHRATAFLATKVGLVMGDPAKFEIKRNGRPEHVRASIDASLKRLRVDAVDLYQLHRVDPEVPIEETWGAMAEIVKAGKAKAIGLSEITLEELERAQRVHPVASVQSELSLWTREHLAIVRKCAAEGIAFLAYSPLGRGFLTGRFTTSSDFEADDWRLRNPRFKDEETIKANLGLVEKVGVVAKKHGRTPGQIALAWALAQGSTVIPIPGTRKIERLEENTAAAEVKLDAADLAVLDALPEARGARY